MALLNLFCVLISIFALPLFEISGFALPKSVDTDEVANPSFAFGWLDDKDTFEAGDIATIKIKVLGNLKEEGIPSSRNSSFCPALTVNGKIGNSSYISGVSLNVDGDSAYWKICFTPILAGVFNVVISDNHFGVFDSSLHFHVFPGPLFPSVSVASWMGLAHEFVAGAKATLLILPKDAFGNNVSSTSREPDYHNFTVFASYLNSSIASVPNITYMGWNEFGYVSIEFIVRKSGSLLLNVAGGNKTLNGSPLTFNVNSGPLDVSSCVAKWNFETNALQIFSKLKIFIHQQDQYGNLVPGLYLFDAEVYEKDTNLSLPVADFQYDEVFPGIQMLSYTVYESGNFKLTIFDVKQKKSISNMPYDYKVFVGYCDGLKSVVNGSGLEGSVAGEVANFSVYLYDIYQYPSPVDVERLRVEIVQTNTSINLLPSIYPLISETGKDTAGGTHYGAINYVKLAPAPALSTDPNNRTARRLKNQASAFDVIFTPLKSGLYEIRVFCGNIPLNGGNPFTKDVRAGEVNMSLSGVVKYEPKVSKLTENEIVVQLLDSFSNPVLMKQLELKLEMGSVNDSTFKMGNFVDNNNGSYTGYYLAKDVGTYEICASYSGKHLFPCPFGANVYTSEYFPKAFDDTVAVWEDESVAIDVLANDFFAGSNASIIESSEPSHGSLLQYGKLFRYTPHKGYFGNDTFSYTISDVNGNLATGSVNISIFSIPPQLVSFPSQLQATEDLISPRFGGFPGFQIRYSDLKENISVTLKAKSGSVFLSPMLMEFWQPMWSGFSVNKGDGKNNDLILVGCVEVINSALQSIQYLGNENFCGKDTIQVSTKNKNGVNDLSIPVFVEPINDPPFIRVPEFIILKKNGSLIFDRESDKFDFYIGDPDLTFADSSSQFLVTFSVEVNSGILVTNLPAELINTTELKLMNSYQWQPLQTFVTISKHFKVKAKGVRFQGTVNNCNSIMEQLFYHGGENGGVLTFAINDLGNYGCYSDCAEIISMPLSAEATVNLIRRNPMSSLLAHTLGSIIAIEFVVVFSLGVLLVFFTCKCAFVLLNERKRHVTNTKPSRAQSPKQTSTPDSSDNATHFTGTCISPFLLSGQASNFRQRSHRQTGSEESSKVLNKLNSSQ